MYRESTMFVFGAMRAHFRLFTTSHYYRCRRNDDGMILLKSSAGDLNQLPRLWKIEQQWAEPVAWSIILLRHHLDWLQF